MKIDHFSIVYDDPMAIYYGGQTVSGKVILKVSEKEIKCNGIFLHCIGMASVHWTERRVIFINGITVVRTIHRRGEERYFDVKVALPDADNLRSIPIGLHTYPFAVVLPDELPTSFEGQYGHIRYICKCNISKSKRFDPRTKTPFTVLSTADLNRIPDAGNPLSVSKTKKVGVLVFKTGDLTVKVTINKSAFVPGEYMLISANINNATKKAVARTCVSVYSITKFYAGTRVRTTTKDLGKLKRGKILPKSEDEWINEPFRIPSIPPSDLGGCKIIQTNYYLKFTAAPEGFLAFDLDLVLPLTIGTIPLMSDFLFIEPSTIQYQQNSGSSMEKQGLTAEPPAYEPSYTHAYPNMPPPSYEESTYGRSQITEDDDNENTSGQTDYAPRYAFYQYSQTPANQVQSSERVN